MIRYLKVWYRMSLASFQTFFVSRFGAVLFLSGKILRFTFFLGFIVLLLSRTNALAGYNIWQIILFYLTFNFIDSVTQMLFREVYRFRSYIITGNFDLLLVKPVNTLFRCLFGWTDFLDFITLIPFIGLIIFAITKLPNVTLTNIVIYNLLVINALLIAASFHILVLALAVLTTEIDHAIMIYRDITNMGKVPVDIYSEPIRSFITFVIPVGIMMSYPVYELFGRLQWIQLLEAFIISIGFLGLSLFVWNYALREYTSASS